MINKIASSVLCLASFSATAATIKNFSFDQETRVISLDVVYSGGCKEHEIGLSLKNGCLETSPVSCAFEVTDKSVGGPDLCEARVFKQETIPAESLGLDDNYYADATITISDREGVKGKFLNSSTPSDDQKVSAVICPAGSGRVVKFIAEYGEVQFLTVGGGEWKQHLDSLSFKTLHLESVPPQISVTIIDDESNTIGGWRYFQGANKFDVTFLGRKYVNCFNQ